MDMFSVLINQDHSIFLNTVNYSLNHVYPPLKTVKDKIILVVAFAALSCLALVYFFYHQCLKSRKIVPLKTESLPVTVMPLKKTEPKAVLPTPKTCLIPEEQKKVLESNQTKKTTANPKVKLDRGANNHKNKIQPQGKVKEYINALICQPKRDFALKGCLEYLFQHKPDFIENASVFDTYSSNSELLVRLNTIKDLCKNNDLIAVEEQLFKLKESNTFENHKRPQEASLYVSALYVACLLQQNTDEKLTLAEITVDSILAKQSAQGDMKEWFSIFKAEIFRQQGDLRAASSHLVNLPTSRHSYADLIRASIHLKNKHLPEAKDIFEHILTELPHNVYACSHSAEISRQQGNIDEALANFKKALELSPDDFYTLVNCAHALYQQNLLSEAKKFCIRALEIDPDDFYASFLYTQILLQQNNLLEAEALLEKISETPLSPDKFYIYSLHGETLRQLRQLEEAKKIFNKAIELQSKDPWTFTCYGETLRQNDELLAAEIQFREALNHDSNNPQAQSGLILVLDKLGRHAEGLKIAESLYPTSPRKEDSKTFIQK